MMFDKPSTACLISILHGVFGWEFEHSLLVHGRTISLSGYDLVFYV